MVTNGHKSTKKGKYSEILPQIANESPKPEKLLYFEAARGLALVTNLLKFFINKFY